MPQEWDGLISQHINRKISCRTARLLANYTKATPNQVTIASFLTGLTAGMVFIFQPLIGGLLAQTSSILDGVDGDLAFLTRQTSVFGGFMDSVLDRYADAAIIIGMIYYASSKHGVALSTSVGFAALIGSLLVSYTRAKAKGDIGIVFKSGLTGYAANRDVRLFIIMLGGIIDQVFATLFVLATLTNLVVIVRACHLYVSAGHATSKGS